MATVDAPTSALYERAAEIFVEQSQIGYLQAENRELHQALEEVQTLLTACRCFLGELKTWFVMNADAQSCEVFKRALVRLGVKAESLERVQ